MNRSCLNEYRKTPYLVPGTTLVFTVTSQLKAHAPILGDTLYRRIQPTVISSFFVAGALRCRCAKLLRRHHYNNDYGNGIGYAYTTVTVTLVQR